MSYYRALITNRTPSDRGLRASYDAAWNEFKENQHINTQLLEQSRKLFEFKGSINPKKLDVSAVVFGLGFSDNLKSELVKFQDSLKKLISLKDYYMVKPDNLAIELIVTKWHDQNEFVEEDNDLLRTEIEKHANRPISISLEGYQIHTDGCVVARIFDNGSIIGLRNKLIENLQDLPNRQSSWCHIPVGRILSPVSKDEAEEIVKLVELKNKSTKITEVINNIKFVHEKQWYMEDYKIIHTHRLGA